MENILHLRTKDLKELASSLCRGRLVIGTSHHLLRQILNSADVAPVMMDLEKLKAEGMTEAQVGTALEMIARDRVGRPRAEQLVTIVTSGPEVTGIIHRDTVNVVPEMFSHACKTVLVAGFAVYRGDKVFESLAKRMEQVKDLRVRLFLDIKRDEKKTESQQEQEMQFVNHFKKYQWPKGMLLPEVYYDIRSLQKDENNKKTSLHAKVVVVDDEKALVTSANFTEAAQERNIEVGLLVNSPDISVKLREYFDALVAGKHCKLILDPSVPPMKSPHQV